jgi:hypothetical protein
MAPAMAPGIELKAVGEVDLRQSALQNQVVEAVYLAKTSKHPGQRRVADAITEFLAAKSIVRERRGKEYDLRPLVHELTLVGAAAVAATKGIAPVDELVLSMRLSLLPGKTGRPDEVLQALGLDPLQARIHRKRLFLSDD